MCRGRITRGDAKAAIEGRCAGIAAACEAGNVKPRRESRVAQREMSSHSATMSADTPTSFSSILPNSTSRGTAPAGYDGALSVANTGRGWASATIRCRSSTPGTPADFALRRCTEAWPNISPRTAVSGRSRTRGSRFAERRDLVRISQRREDLHGAAISCTTIRSVCEATCARRPAEARRKACCRRASVATRYRGAERKRLAADGAGHGSASDLAKPPPSA